MSPRTGRPKSDNPRGHMVTLRLNNDEYTACKAAAEKTAEPLGVWARQRIVAAARRTK